MKIFLGVLSTGKGTWGQVAHIIDNTDYDKVYLISNEWAQDKFECTKKINWIIIDPRKGFTEIMEDLKKQWPKDLNNKIDLNIHSGSGKEHCAILSMLLQNNIKYNIITINAEGIQRY
jgi:cobalamin biosynthesis Co2+ chelatase CbiK